MNDIGGHGRWEENLAAYALGALGDSESAELELHLDACERCRAELRWLEPAVGVLPASVQQVEPPRRMRRQVMATVRAEARAAHKSEGKRRSPGWMIPALAGGVAAALLVAMVIDNPLGDDGGKTSTIAATTLTPEVAGAEAVLTRSGSVGTLEVDGMPPLRGGRVYQAWVMVGNEPQPSTTFLVDRSGSGAAAIPDLAEGREVLVTEEPKGGSETPSKPLLSARLNPS